VGDQGNCLVEFNIFVRCPDGDSASFIKVWKVCLYYINIFSEELVDNLLLQLHVCGVLVLKFSLSLF